MRLVPLNLWGLYWAGGRGFYSNVFAAHVLRQQQVLKFAPTATLHHPATWRQPRNRRSQPKAYPEDPANDLDLRIFEVQV